MSIAGSCGFFAPVYLLSWVYFSQRTAPFPPPHTPALDKKSSVFLKFCSFILSLTTVLVCYLQSTFSWEWISSYFQEVEISLYSPHCQERQCLPGQPSWIQLFSNLSVVQRGEVTPQGQLSGVKLYGDYPVCGPEGHNCSIYLLLLCCSLFRAHWGKTHSFLGCFGWVFLLVFISP